MGGKVAPVLAGWGATDSNLGLLPLHVTFPLFRTFSHVGEVFPMVGMDGFVPIGERTFQERKTFPVAAGMAWVSFEFLEPVLESGWSGSCASEILQDCLKRPRRWVFSPLRSS